MNITLKPEQEQFIESQIKQGVFTDFTQAIDLALNLLQAQDSNYIKWLEETRQKIDVGRVQWEKGQHFPLEVAIECLSEKTEISQGKGWPLGFLESTWGSCAEDPIILDDAGVSAELDDNLEGVFD